MHFIAIFIFKVYFYHSVVHVISFPAGRERQRNKFQEKEKAQDCEERAR